MRGLGLSLARGWTNPTQRLLSTDPLSRTRADTDDGPTQYEYDNGRLIAVKEHPGTAPFRYEPHRFLIPTASGQARAGGSEERASSAQLARPRARGAVDSEYRYQYDRDERLRSIVGRDHDRRVPCADGLVAGDELSGSSGWTFFYDARGRIVECLRAPPAGGNGSPSRYTFTYGAAGDLMAVQDPLGRVTSCTRDAEGRITRITYPAGTSCDFSHAARPRSPRPACRSPFTYGTVVKTIDPTGAVVRFQYSAREGGRPRVTDGGAHEPQTPTSRSSRASSPLARESDDSDTPGGDRR
jgi:YD repeat-containing protein